MKISPLHLFFCSRPHRFSSPGSPSPFTGSVLVFYAMTFTLRTSRPYLTVLRRFYAGRKTLSVSLTDAQARTRPGSGNSLFRMAGSCIFSCVAIAFRTSLRHAFCCAVDLRTPFCFFLDDSSPGSYYSMSWHDFTLYTPDY